MNVLKFLLVAALAGYTGWHLSGRRAGSASLQFNFKTIRTNGCEGLMIIDKRTGDPIWARWDLDGDAKPDTFSYFFQGKDVMDIHVRAGMLPRREVIFYDENNRAKISWIDRSGQGLFTERVFYGPDTPRLEVWYKEGWRGTTKRGSHRGIELDGVWFPLQITNGEWTVAPPAAVHGDER